MPNHHDDRVVLPADTNQARGIARFAIDFMSGDPDRRGRPDPEVVERTNLFHTDAVICGLSALALGTNAPTVLREEALQYPAPTPGYGTLAPPGRAQRNGAPVFGSTAQVMPEKAIAANCAAVREWDSNGTNFGYSQDRPEHRAGEFGHNDFYSVPVAAAHMVGADGEYALRGMVLHDEIRGRLAEVFSLKSYKIDHVLHGAIASAAVFGAMLGATAEQIESAIGMTVAHYVPFRAIRHGHQLSDSKGASAAISTEAAVLAVKRAMAGFIGPADIFRNPEAVFRLFEGPAQYFQRVSDVSRGEPPRTERLDASPFDLVLTRAGADFTVMGMHFKIGLYEHQSAGALQGLVDLLQRHPDLLDDPRGERIRSITVTAYEPAFSIIGDPHKRDPRTRQSADHSMLYLVCTMLRKALELRASGRTPPFGWPDLMLVPHDYTREAITHPLTRSLMQRMDFRHGGPEYDEKYPDGIPTSIAIADADGNTRDSGLVMYPAGHARNTGADLEALLDNKFRILGALATDDVPRLLDRLAAVQDKPAAGLLEIYAAPIRARGRFE